MKPRSEAGGLIAFLHSDLSGMLRGRAFPKSALDDRLVSGVGWVPANLALTPFDARAVFILSDPEASCIRNARNSLGRLRP